MLLHSPRACGRARFWGRPQPGSKAHPDVRRHKRTEHGVAPCFATVGPRRRERTLCGRRISRHSAHSTSESAAGMWFLIAPQMRAAARRATELGVPPMPGSDADATRDFRQLSRRGQAMLGHSASSAGSWFARLFRCSIGRNPFLFSLRDARASMYDYFDIPTFS
jgi:hypothetical protein